MLKPFLYTSVLALLLCSCSNNEGDQSKKVVKAPEENSQAPGKNPGDTVPNPNDSAFINH